MQTWYYIFMTALLAWTSPATAFPAAVSALRSGSSQGWEQFELPDRSKTQEPQHPSNARPPETRSLRPSRTLFEYSNPAWSEAEFGLHDPSVPKTRRASGPRTVALGRLQFVRACCHSAV